MKLIQCMITLFVAMELTTTSFAGITKWKISDVKDNKEKTADGRVFIKFMVSLESKGDRFTGVFDSAIEVSDAKGMKRYFTKSASMPSDSGGINFSLNITSMDKPAISGYSIRLTIDGFPAPADEKHYRCKSREELDARNLDSQKMETGGLFKPPN